MRILPAREGKLSLYKKSCPTAGSTFVCKAVCNSYFKIQELSILDNAWYLSCMCHSYFAEDELHAFENIKTSYSTL